MYFLHIKELCLSCKDVLLLYKTSWDLTKYFCSKIRPRDLSWTLGDCAY